MAGDLAAEVQANYMIRAVAVYLAICVAVNLIFLSAHRLD